MKHFSGAIVLALLTVCVLAVPAAAQAPSRLPPAPVASPSPEPGSGFFPQLPPSRLCNSTDLYGGWRLQHVYENPASQAIIQFSAQPNQYLYFRGDNTYVDYKSAYAENFVALIGRMKVEKTPELQQFVFDKTGFIFLYKNGLSIDTLACFIVTNPTSIFLPGQMLLMPPEGQSTTRLVKQYIKVDGPAPVVPPPAGVVPKPAAASVTGQSLTEQQRNQQIFQQQIDQQRQQSDLRQQQIQQQRDRIALQKQQNQQQIQLQQQQEQINQIQQLPPTQ